MKNTTQHPLKQKWTVPIDNGGEKTFGLNGLNEPFKSSLTLMAHMYFQLCIVNMVMFVL